MKKISRGVFAIPIISDQADVENDQNIIIRAQERIIRFLDQHGIDVSLEKPFVEKVMVFSKQGDLIQKIKEELSMASDYPFPKTISGLVINHVLMMISPDVYQDIYPIEGNTKKGYEKLMTHEMAHELHIRFLNGDEEHMGPEWFYEGFALVVADQLQGSKISFDRFKQILTKNASASYVEYRAMMDIILQYTSINEMLTRAHLEDFPTWIMEILEGK